MVFVAMVHTGRRLISVKSRTVFPATSATQRFRRSPVAHRQRGQHDFHRQRGENNSHHPDEDGRALPPDDPQDDIGKTQENVGHQQHYQQKITREAAAEKITERLHGKVSEAGLVDCSDDRRSPKHSAQESEISPTK